MKDENSINIVTDSNFHRCVIESIKPVVVLFEKSYWGLAQVMRTILERLSVKHMGQIKFYRYNLDNDSNIASYYQIEDSPTVLFFKSGSLIMKTGIKSINETEEILTHMINEEN